MFSDDVLERADAAVLEHAPSSHREWERLFRYYCNLYHFQTTGVTGSAGGSSGKGARQGAAERLGYEPAHIGVAANVVVLRSTFEMPDLCTQKRGAASITVVAH